MTASRGAVFLSYSSEDADVAQRICTSLRDAGIEVWFDQSALRGGDAWDAEIRQQIRSCSLCIPVISASTCARAEGYFRLEWKFAVERPHLMAAEKAFIVPVVIDGTRESTALVPDKFREVQWTRLINQDDTQGLVAQVQRLLVREPQTEPSTRPVETGTAIALGAYGAAGLRGNLLLRCCRLPICPEIPSRTTLPTGWSKASSRRCHVSTNFLS